MKLSVCRKDTIIHYGWSPLLGFCRVRVARFRFLRLLRLELFNFFGDASVHISIDAFLLRLVFLAADAETQVVDAALADAHLRAAGPPDDQEVDDVDEYRDS